jgi:hypothetical protein
MNLRRGLMMGMGKDDWTIILHPIDGESRLIPCISFNVTVGQKLIVRWKSDALYTSRYFMRTLTASLDNEGQYKIYTPSSYGISGEETYTVTTAGSIVFAGYTVGLGTTCLIGDYVKIKIENPTE